MCGTQHPCSKCQENDVALVVGNSTSASIPLCSSANREWSQTSLHSKPHRIAKSAFKCHGRAPKLLGSQFWQDRTWYSVSHMRTAYNSVWWTASRLRQRLRLLTSQPYYTFVSQTGKFTQTHCQQLAPHEVIHNDAGKQHSQHHLTSHMMAFVIWWRRPCPASCQILHTNPTAFCNTWELRQERWWIGSQPCRHLFSFHFPSARSLTNGVLQKAAARTLAKAGRDRTVVRWTITLEAMEGSLAAWDSERECLENVWQRHRSPELPLDKQTSHQQHPPAAWCFNTAKTPKTHSFSASLQGDPNGWPECARAAAMLLMDGVAVGILPSFSCISPSNVSWRGCLVHLIMLLAVVVLEKRRGWRWRRTCRNQPTEQTSQTLPANSDYQTVPVSAIQPTAQAVTFLSDTVDVQPIHNCRPQSTHTPSWRTPLDPSQQALWSRR